MSAAPNSSDLPNDFASPNPGLPPRPAHDPPAPLPHLHVPPDPDNDSPGRASRYPEIDPRTYVPIRHTPWRALPRLADVAQRGVRWLWPGRIPLGKITLLVGDPGVGKSLLALDVAARVTVAAPWPDANHDGQMTDDPVADNDQANAASDPSSTNRPSDNPPAPGGSVLLLSAEDDLADTIRPRLEAAGADCSRVIAMPPGWSPEDPCGYAQDVTIPDLRPLAERPPGPRPFDLRHDIELLASVLQTRPDFRLIVVDPLSAFLGGVLESSNARIRGLFAPLAELAARRRVAVLVVSHLRKKSGSALHRAIGSLAITASARAAWLVAKDPADERRRLMLPMKNNLGVSRGLSFTIAPAAPDRPPVLAWSSEPVDVSADEALKPARPPRPPRVAFEREDAARWLRVMLAERPRPSVELQREAVAHGLQLITVRRAFRELGGEAVRVGYGPLGQWYWRLPGTADPTPKPAEDDLWGGW